jgi:NCK-associated protein 1
MDDPCTMMIPCVQLIGEMCAALGVPSRVDMALVNAIRAQTHAMAPDEHYQLSCLLIVFIAVALPRLAQAHATFFKASLAGGVLQGRWKDSHRGECDRRRVVHHASTGGCRRTDEGVSRGEIYHCHTVGGVGIRVIVSIVQLASSSLLRMNDELDREEMKNPESVYLLLDKVSRLYLSVIMDPITIVPDDPR